MHATHVFSESRNATQRTSTWMVVVYLLHEQPRDAVSLFRTCGQSAVIPEVISAQPAHKKALPPDDECAGIECGRGELDQFAVNEIADLDRSDWRLWDISGNANVNCRRFAPRF